MGECDYEISVSLGVAQLHSEKYGAWKCEKSATRHQNAYEEQRGGGIPGKSGEI